MHKNLPYFFIFLDQYNSKVFKYKNKNIGIIYRDYNDRNKEIQLIKISKACKKNRYQLYISNDVKLAIKYKANGVYAPSFNKTKFYLNLENRNIVVIGSAHNQKEIQNKILQKCAAIFLSPIFYVEKSKNFLDLYKFNYLSYANKANMFALGGILENNLNKLKLLNISGFGGITVFKKKPAYKRPVFVKNNFF